MRTFSTTSLRFAVDVVLFGLFLVLLSPRLTGLPPHEWLGLALGVPVLVHLLLSWAWISRATRLAPIRSGWRHRINYALNWALFALVVLEIVSGLMISVVALPALGIPTIEDGAWRLLHNRFLNLLVLVLGIHIAMNWNVLRVGIRRWLMRVTS